MSLSKASFYYGVLVMYLVVPRRKAMNIVSHVRHLYTQLIVFLQQYPDYSHEAESRLSA